MQPGNDMIVKYLETLNTFKRSTFVLKGGTALAQCYGVPRISVDIDLDAPARSARNNVMVPATEKFCATYNCSFRLARNSVIVQHVFVHAPEDDDQPLHKPLKVEASFRRQHIKPDEVTTINGIAVYTLPTLVGMKCLAYRERDTFRDLFDLSYIATHYQGELPPESQDAIAAAFAAKGIGQLDYLLKAAECPADMDALQLGEMFLDAYVAVGLMNDESI